VGLDIVRAIVCALDLILLLVRHLNSPFARRPLPTH
jgi:hypothetical protein